MDERLFYQLAATLIPAFLLAGALSPLFRPGRIIERGRGRRRFVRVALVTAAVGLALFAELVAIDLSLQPEFTFWKVFIVVYTVAGLSAVVGVAIVEPWYRGIGTERQTRTLRHLGKVVATVAFGGSALYLLQVVGDVSLIGLEERSACRAAYLSDLTEKFAADADEESRRFTNLLRLLRERERVRRSSLPRVEKDARIFILDRQIIEARSEVPSAIMEARLSEITRVLEGGAVPGC